MRQPLVVAISGASGAVYAVRLVEVLMQSGHDVHLTISSSARSVLRQELHVDLDLQDFDPQMLVDAADKPGRLTYHYYKNLSASIASGSFRTAGMVICPCSGGTLSAVAHGGNDNLIHRAADVHLKERRKLILVPRETPLSLPFIENMRLATLAGAVVLPAAPGWYQGVNSVLDLVDFVVARVVDQLGIEHTLSRRWGDISG